MLYDRMKAACEERGTTITVALREIGRAEGNTGNWKMGKSPKLDIVMELAEHLGMSLDELVYGKTVAEQRGELTVEQKELLSIFARIPEDKRAICLDFLRTHMMGGV